MLGNPAKYLAVKIILPAMRLLIVATAGFDAGYFLPNLVYSHYGCPFPVQACALRQRGQNARLHQSQSRTSCATEQRTQVMA